MQSRRLTQKRARKSLLLPVGSCPVNLAKAQKASQERRAAMVASRRRAWDWVRRRTTSRERTGGEEVEALVAGGADGADLPAAVGQAEAGAVDGGGEVEARLAGAEGGVGGEHARRRARHGLIWRGLA
jgi:hypothetical protein